MTYDEYIKNIINTRGQWNIESGEYWEGHHIVPRCLGGEGETYQKHPNIIRLYAKEHYIAHKLLAEENPNNIKLVSAFSMMAFPKGKTNREGMLTSDEYEEARKFFSTMISGENNPSYGKTPWNKGLTKQIDERVNKYARSCSKTKLGVKTGPFTLEHCKNMSIAARKRDNSNNHSNLNKKAISNRETGVLYYISVDEQLPDGFEYGNIKTTGEHNMTNYYNNPSMKKRRSELSSGKNNPMYGKGYKLSGGKNGKAIYNYYFEEKEFDCRKSLIEYLQSNGYNISENAIRSIQNGTYGKCTLNKYSYIIDNLRWSLKDEDKVN